MADKRGIKRLYSEEEVGTLIQRATELQKETKDSADKGLLYEEIEHIALEIGIDPEHLRSAAIELEGRTEEDRRFHLLGGPFMLAQKRVVEGTVTEGQWEQIVMGLRRITGSRGRTDRIGQTLEWTRAIKDMQFTIERTQVSLSPREDQTTIEVRKHFRGGALMAYSLGVLMSGTVAGVFLDGAGLSDLMNTAIVAGSAVSGLAVARASLGYWMNRQRQRVKQMTEWLRDTISQSGALTTTGEGYHELPENLEEAEFQPAAPSSRRLKV